jgi:hypothetical protein
MDGKPRSVKVIAKARSSCHAPLPEPVIDEVLNWPKLFNFYTFSDFWVLKTRLFPLSLLAQGLS